MCPWPCSSSSIREAHLGHVVRSGVRVAGGRGSVASSIEMRSPLTASTRSLRPSTRTSSPTLGIRPSRSNTTGGGAARSSFGELNQPPAAGSDQRVLGDHEPRIAGDQHDHRSEAQFGRHVTLSSTDFRTLKPCQRMFSSGRRVRQRRACKRHDPLSGAAQRGLQRGRLWAPATPTRNANRRRAQRVGVPG